MGEKKIITLIILVMFLLLFSGIVFGVAEEKNDRREEKDSIVSLEVQSTEEKERAHMKVNFYRFDKVKKENGECLGYAELSENGLIYNVSDPRLEMMLKGDFHTMIPAEKDGRIINKFVTYKVGSREHLEKVVENCKHISCIGERNRGIGVRP